MTDEGTFEKQLAGAQLVMAVLVDRLGGTVHITDDDYLDARDWNLKGHTDREGREVIFTVTKDADR